MPKRIQRKRTKGWRIPEGAVYVGRPTRWGNPYSLREWESYAMPLFRNAANGIFDPSVLPKEWEDWRFHDASQLFNWWINQFGDGPVNAAESELRGKDLACWCPLDQPCHADILLEIANWVAPREPETVEAR